MSSAVATLGVAGYTDELLLALLLKTGASPGACDSKTVFWVG